LESIYRFARVLLAEDAQSSNGLAVLVGNRPELFYIRTAAQLLGVRVTPLHPLSSALEHAFILEDAEIDGMIFDPRFEEEVVGLRERVPLRMIGCLGPSGVGFDLLDAATQQIPEPPATGPVRTPMGLFYTGGTTGQPKGVIMRPTAQAFAAATMGSQWQWPDDVRMLLSTPLNHAAGTMLAPTFARGGTAIILPSFSAEAWLHAVALFKVTAALIVPTQLYRILDSPSLIKTDLSTLKTVFYGASPCSPTRLAEAIREFGQVFFQFYGQNEAPMTVCTLRKEEHDLAIPRRLSSCGRPAPGVEVRLLDDQGDEVRRGEPGEICVRGPLVGLDSYKNRPEETAAALQGGWLHTGDVATEDEEGFLYIVDRKKDVIVSGASNIYPREIEDMLVTHPAVSQAAVIGVPDDLWGESVKAIVVRRSGHDDVTEGVLVQFVKDHLGSMHAPKSLDFVNSIPLSPLGKPDKKALRAQHWAGRDRAVN
jgi:fatty-acyl-CoA synthase